LFKNEVLIPGTINYAIMQLDLALLILVGFLERLNKGLNL